MTHRQKQQAKRQNVRKAKTVWRRVEHRRSMRFPVNPEHPSRITRAVRRIKKEAIRILRISRVTA